ncbi:T9SS type A sorting domain-containing protein [Pedobacter xixiisoli]|uniref:Secretion system C-terminal sorting domain-containing protein n=1 Tax=Pedobacter xixiisoli TaxID=1476464 RepID=A0A286AEA9_9SPHI|nr:T9SS type A sorting domain-containing protein [Pedobacter xixiisoli]SOD20235.1 hypothetical protein SAMN06297358_3948 [Pedobacter xixiisoli]
MKKRLLLLLAMGLGFGAHAQLVGGTVYPINGTDNVSPRTFASLRSAVTYVNTAGLSGTGQAILEFTAPYANEAVASPIIINALPGASATLGLTIRPATGMTVSLTANLSGQRLIDLNDADYVTLDGRPGGVGTSSAFTLENTNTTNTGGTSVVRLINDAQFNKLSYLTFKTAAAVNTLSGAVLLSTSAAGTTGNTDNSISHNTFTFASTYVVANAPGIQIASAGTAARPNNRTQVLNNNFEYWGGRGAILANDGAAWQINNNHFYNTFATQPLVADGNNGFAAIYLAGSTGGHTIDGNFIGGKAANAGGAKMDITAQNVQFIYVSSTSTAAKTTVQNNTIANINASTPTNGITSYFRVIYTPGSQIVDILNNTIGSASTANSLVMTRNATANGTYPMILLDNTGDTPSNVKNNTIANLQFNDLAGGNNFFYGILANAGTGGKIIDGNTITKLKLSGALSVATMIINSVDGEITNNNIGSQTLTNDIVVETTRTGTSSAVYSTGDYATKITGNQIGGFSVKTTLATAASSNFYGIYAVNSLSAGTLKTVENNLVGGTVANSLQTIPGGGAGTAQVGIAGIFTNGSINRNNTVRNITADETGTLVGIQFGSTVSGNIESNTIENLTLNGQASSSYVAGLTLNAVGGTTPIIDNTISGIKSSNAVALSSVGIKHVMGIYGNGSGALSSNKISNLEATGAGATSVYGIVSRSGNVLKNRIYDLKSSNATVGASIGGIALTATSSTTASFTVSNNVINVNYSGDVPAYGILAEFAGTGTDPALTIRAFYNTILLEGTASGSAISSAIYRTSDSPLDVKNNLFFNNRSGGSGIHSLYGATTTAPAWVSNYNFLATPAGNSNVGNWNGTAQDFAAWKASQSGQDANSVNNMTLTPSTLFNTTLGATDFLRTTVAHNQKVAGKGTTVSVTDDILGATRAATPSMGAFEEELILPLAGGTVYQINGTDSGNGATRTFASLRSASVFANTYGLTGTGQAVLEFTAPYTNETIGATSITFNALANASATLGLTIRPATGMSVSLTASLAALPLIDLNDADYITLDGRPGGVGTTGAFIVQNTNTNAASSTIRMINDAQFNKLTYLDIRLASVSNATTAAVLLSTSASGTTGNTDNNISYNTFSMPASGYTAGATQTTQILSAGTAARPNHNTSILNNNFAHWGGLGAVYSTSGNNWQINNNHFYSTLAVKGSGSVQSGAINLSNSDGHTIDGNFFGGQAANAGGSKMGIDAYNWSFISVNGTSTAAKTTIQNNTFANMDAGTPSGSTAANFRAIYTLGNQMVDVLNNTIGSASTANSLVMNKNTTNTGLYYFIQTDNTGDVATNIKNNTFANLRFNGLGGASLSNIYGIYANVGTGGKMIDNNTFSKITATGTLNEFRLIYTNVLSEITNNKIGSQSSTADIVVESTRQNPFYGIGASGDFASKITGNQIGGISRKVTLATSGNGGAFYLYNISGSTTTATLKTVENNIIGGTVANSIQTIAGGGAGQENIALEGLYGSAAIIRNNTVRNMTLNTDGYIIGIDPSGSVAGSLVENNTIENLTSNAQSNNGFVSGILTSGTSNINSNTISGLKSSNAVTFSTANKHVTGINHAGSGTVSGNRVYNLEATGAGATLVYGIVARPSSILKNRVYDLKSSNATTGASIGGIALNPISSSTGSYTLANNVVNVNYSGDVPVYGILAEFTNGGTDPALAVNASYNTILLEGTASGSAISSAIYRTSNGALDLKNNLLFNNLSGGSGIHSLYGATTTAPAWVSNYNFLATAAANTNVGNWNGTAQNFAAWKASQSGQDANSVNDMAQTPSAFFNLASASTDFLRTTASGKLKVGNLATPTSVTDDILGTSRAATPTIGAFEEVVVLPVTFNGFTARLNGNKVNLAWNVSSEVDIIRYEVERLTNGTDFVKVATVAAGQLNGYSAVDANPQLGSNYYRLLAINSDGTATYFNEIKEVKVASLGESAAVVYPNPLVGNTIHVAMASFARGTYTYKLVDITGKLLQRGSFVHQGGSNTITVEAAMPKGVYVLQVSNGKEQIQTKLIRP